MSVLLVLGWLWAATAAADVTVTIAPDQPLPYVYTDDPLVLEFVSPKEVNARVRLRLQAGPEAPPQEISLGDLTLPAGSPRWCAIKDAPSDRGFYTVETSVEIGDEVVKKNGRFCRVDRPDGHYSLPLAVAMPAASEYRAFLAMKSIGVKMLRLNTADSEFENAFVRGQQMGFMMILEIDPRDKALFSGVLEKVAGKGALIKRWEIPLASLSEGPAVLDPLRHMGGSVQVYGVASNRDEAIAACAAGSPAFLDGCVLAGDDLPAAEAISSIKKAAAQQGTEDFPVVVRMRGVIPADAASSVEEVLTKSMEIFAAGVGEIGMEAVSIFNEGNLTETAAYLNGLAVRMNALEYVGDAALSDGASAKVFRRNATWFMALWSKKGETVSVPLDGVVGFKITDAFGNVLAGPDSGADSISVEVGNCPKYLSGVGGVILGKTASFQAGRQAQEFLHDTALTQAIGGNVRDIVSAIQKDMDAPESRGRFLELVRQLPRIEGAWHSGQLPVSVAVPSMAMLAALSRSLCMVEDERGEHFLEPLTDTISRCEELQSLYLTGSSARPDERSRGEWLLGEVRRLVDESESLEAAGRKVEASAVAVVAEWRAKGLPMAARNGAVADTAAPVSAPVVKENPPEKKEEKKKEKAAEEDPSKEDSSKKSDDTAPDKADAKEDADAGGSSSKDKGAGASGKTEHVVASGESPYTIAKKYGVDLEDLLAWNNLKKNSRLNIGDKLVVHGGEVKKAVVKKGKADTKSNKSVKKKRKR